MSARQWSGYYSTAALTIEHSIISLINRVLITKVYTIMAIIGAGPLGLLSVKGIPDIGL